MDNLPSIVVVSSSCTRPRSIIKLITTKIPEEHPADLMKQTWKIDTKYYTAFANLIGIDAHYPRNDSFNNSVEALIIHMDSNKSTGLEDLKQWESLEEDCQPEIKLLLANYCNDETKITKTNAVDWCLDKGFEFVELYPADTEPSEDQDIIEEKFGINRVIEALHAHAWPNLVMKKSNNHASEKNYIVKDEPKNNATLSEDELKAEDEFTELFSQLNFMKENLQTLPVNQRRQCAEQMVTAFWKAIGGEEDDLLDV